ncbi:MAG: radical SAM protein [Chloroflexi bacterium]|nr:radical SAM protein [Chloroflexota bacterium]
MQGTPYQFFVQWHLTERCNLRCRHCYQQKNMAELDYAAVRQGMANIKEALDSWETQYDMKLSPSYQFTGGEPLLRRDLFEILAQARESGFATSLMSNGLLITPDIAHHLWEAGVADVQISLEGLETVHDYIRGQGTFWRTLRGIENLRNKDIDCIINVTLSRLNMGQIEGLAQLAETIGVRYLSFSRLVPCGRGEELADEALTPQELAGLYRSLEAINAGGKVKVSSLDPLATIAAMKEDVPQGDFPVGGCAAGMFGVTIAADGSIMPCRRMGLSIGNIAVQSFRVLWAESPVLWSLRSRQSYHNGCESCYYWAVCRGCRAIALAYARAEGKEDYLGADPQCPYYRKAASQ